MKKSQYILLGIAIIAIAFVLYKSNRYEPTVATWKGTDIPCLPGGHANALLHIHPELTINFDGVKEEIPANLGVDNTCMAEVHTHDATGKIHIESTEPTKTYLLSDFFKIYNEDFMREGFNMEVSVNGEVSLDPANIILKDHDQIVVNYISTNEPGGNASGKININVVCEGALAYMIFPDGASAEQFVAECKEGKHPEVIDRWKVDNGIDDDRAI